MQAWQTKFGALIVVKTGDEGPRGMHPSVLTPVGGKPLLVHVLACAKAVMPAADQIAVFAADARPVETLLSTGGVRVVDSLSALAGLYQGGAGWPQHLLLLPADAPLLTPDVLRQLCEAHLQGGALTTTLQVADAGMPPTDLAGVVAVDAAALLVLWRSPEGALQTITVEDTVATLVRRSNHTAHVPASAAATLKTVTTMEDVAAADTVLRTAAVQRLMAAGVVIYRPETVTVDAGVEVGPGTVLEPFTQVLGSTRIGSNCRIRSYSVVEDSTLGDNVLLRNGCILAFATVESDALLGPYAHLRPGSNIGRAAHVGNFVETKNTTLGAGSKANHLSYLGDAVIGIGTNIGAGVITCNYDGVHKHRTTIGDNVFVGSDAALVAPLTVESDAFIAAASCITEDVPPGALALGRARQVLKPDWAKRNANR